MYSAVRTHDYEYPESEMDDRESLYFDTISLADSEAAAAAAAHRKSLSQSRNTIYHSAVDLVGDDTPSKRSSLRLDSSKNARAPWNANYRHSAALENFHNTNGNGTAGSGGGPGTGAGAGGGGDATDAAIAAQVIAMQNGLGNAVGSAPAPYLSSDETRRRFQDGIRVVDFVLAYNGDDHKLENLKKREIFEANLEREGLHLERDNTQRIHFIKLHAPVNVLCRYAEVLKIKLPLRKIPGQDRIYDDTITSKLDRDKFPPRPKRIHCEFSRAYQHLFDWEQPNFFDAGVRNSIINFILERQHFVEGEETPDNLGIEKLLTDGVYDSAYTLHDDTDRDLLLSEWASLSKWKSLQPLDNIKEYFGPKVALYFAWLGFYTHMLIPVSVIGILCFIYGFITWNTDVIGKEICNDNKTTLMCPQCDRNCDFWQLEDTCKSARMNYLIDNNITVVFACIMSIWAVVYLELWKRYSAGLVHRWGLTGFSHEIEHPRPQYLAKISNDKKLAAKVNVANNVFEPDVPFWSTKFLSNFTSYGVVLLFICISLIAIFSMIVYRMAQKASHSILGNENSMTYRIMVLPMTAGIIDLIVISLLDYVYSYLAVYLTNLEFCRTHTEYNESLTIKNYIFQFVNYYSSLFYIAFLKGKFVGQPKKYNRILGFRQEECNPGGCLMELCMQLVIIMVGKQAVNAIVEMLGAYLSRKFKRVSMRIGIRHRDSEEKLVSCNQWTEDYHLQPWTNNSMFAEYLEMVLQFGFVTLFGLAFPLAPLLALINNIIEVRLDAIKMLNFIRRPVAQRASNIGVWHNILTIVTKIAVASTAVIIAFSTNLIPKLVYKFTTKDQSLEGYLNFTLAYFNTKDFEVKPMLLGSPYENVTSCRYTEFRNPWWDERPYKRPLVYWHIMTWRLAFIVIFQNIIGALQAAIAWAIPDVPGPLRKRIKRENFLLREHIIEYEKKSAAEKAAAQQALYEMQQLQQQHHQTYGSKLLHDGAGNGSHVEATGGDVVRNRFPDNANTSEAFVNDRTTPV